MTFVDTPVRGGVEPSGATNVTLDVNIGATQILDATGDVLKSYTAEEVTVAVLVEWDGEKWKSTGTTSGTPIGATIVFEGAVENAHQTTLTVAEPTADRTITLPNVTGTVSLVAGTETLTNKTFTAPTINAVTFSSGTTTAGMNIGASGIVFEGATADSYETTLNVVDPTADRVITIPNSTMTAITTATHATKANHIVKCMALG